ESGDPLDFTTAELSQVFGFLQDQLDAATQRAEAAETIIAQNDLCHNQHGKVDARALADGCADEQRKHYGCAPDADEVAKLKQRVEDLEGAANMRAELGDG